MYLYLLILILNTLNSMFELSCQLVHQSSFQLQNLNTNWYEILVFNCVQILTNIFARLNQVLSNAVTGGIWQLWRRHRSKRKDSAPTHLLHDSSVQTCYTAWVLHCE